MRTNKAIRIVKASVAVVLMVVLVAAADSRHSYTAGLVVACVLASALFWMIVRFTLRTSGARVWRASLSLPVRGRWLCYLASALLAVPGILSALGVLIGVLALLGVIH